MLYLGGPRQDIAKVAVRNGWQPHVDLLGMVSEEEAIAHRFWIYAFREFVR